MPPRRPASRTVGPSPAAARPPHPPRPSRTDPIVRASELGSFAYCERAWWLRYVAGREPAVGGQGRLAAGHQRHAAHGETVRRAGLLWRVGLACAGLAALIILTWLIAALLAR